MARSKKAQAAIDDAMSMDSDVGKVGLGIDMVEIARVRAVLERTPSFARRCFSDAEREYCMSTVDPAKGFAARFAAKEAAVKALGTGFSDGVWLRDVEVERDRKGRPRLVLHGAAERIASERGIEELAVSLSHTDRDAVACVMAISSESLAVDKRQETPAEELARRFKETRGMLDDLGRPDDDAQAAGEQS